MTAVVVRLRDAPKRQSPLRRPNAALRVREHLHEREVEKLIDAAKGNRHGRRDATMILIAFRHGLRASEVCDLRWDQVHLTSANLDVRRRKNGVSKQPWPCDTPCCDTPCHRCHSAQAHARARVVRRSGRRSNGGQGDDQPRVALNWFLAAQTTDRG
jgi:integrase